MKRLILVLLICLLGISAFADYQSPVTMHKANFFAIGEEEDAQAKWQLSMKFNLLYPFESGLYFAFTQLSYWRIYDKSSPFIDTNFNPEVFYKFESGRNIFGNAVIPLIDHVIVSPYEHRSNGKDGEDSRSEDKYYGEIQLSVGEVYNVGVRLRGFGYYDVSSKNEDINDYHRNYEAGVFFKVKSKTTQYLDKEEIRVNWGGDPRNKGYVQVEAVARILTTYVQPKLFFQYYYGYDEFMKYYNVKTDHTFRLGLSF